jgi:hypothetical protein
MMQTSIDASRESAESFKKQETFVRELMDALNAISAAMKQMDADSNHILSLMENKNPS